MILRSRRGQTASTATSVGVWTPTFSETRDDTPDTSAPHDSTEDKDIGEQLEQVLLKNSNSKRRREDSPIEISDSENERAAAASKRGPRQSYISISCRPVVLIPFLSSWKDACHRPKRDC
jgi:hypothetical protein